MPVIDLKNSTNIDIDGFVAKPGAFPLIHVSGSKTGKTIFKNVGITQTEKQLLIEKEVPKNMVQVVE